MQPPIVAETLLGQLMLDESAEHSVLGDLAEGWSERASVYGVRRANGWYWKQTVRSLPPLVAEWWRGASPRDRRQRWKAVGIGFLMLALQTTPAERVAAVVHGTLPHGLVKLCLSLFVGALTGFAIALVQSRTRLANVLAFMATYLAFGAFVTVAVRATMPWYAWAELCAMLPGGWLGVGHATMDGRSTPRREP